MKIQTVKLTLNNNSNSVYTCTVPSCRTGIVYRDQIAFGIKKNDFDNIFDLTYAKMLKMSLNDFNTIKEFNNTIQTKIAEVMNLNNYNASSKSSTKTARNILNNWKNYLEGEDWKNFLNSNEWKGEQHPEFFVKSSDSLSLIIFSSIAKNITPNKKNLPLDLDVDVLKETVICFRDNLKLKKPNNLNFNNIYKEKMQEKYSEGIQILDTGSKIGHWICVPCKSGDLETNIKRLYLNSCSTWCVRTRTKGAKHLKKGDCYVFLVNDKPKVYIEIANNELMEVQGEKNNWKIPRDFMDDIKLFFDKVGVNNSLYKPKTLKGWVRALLYREFFKIN